MQVTIEIEDTDVLAAAAAIDALIRSIKDDPNEFRRTVGIANRVPKLTATAAALRAAYAEATL